MRVNYVADAFVAVVFVLREVLRLGHCQKNVRTYCTVHSNALHVADRRPPDHDVERFDDRRGCWKMKGCDPYVQLACASVWFHEDVDELCQPCCSLG